MTQPGKKYVPRTGDLFSVYEPGTENLCFFVVLEVSRVGHVSAQRIDEKTYVARLPITHSIWGDCNLVVRPKRRRRDPAKS